MTPRSILIPEPAPRAVSDLGSTHEDIDDILDYLRSVAGLDDEFYLWRRYLPDPEDCWGQDCKSNWLPAPMDSGFTMNLRVEALDGKWAWPAITQAE